MIITISLSCNSFQIFLYIPESGKQKSCDPPPPPPPPPPHLLKCLSKKQSQCQSTEIKYNGKYRSDTNSKVKQIRTDFEGLTQYENNQLDAQLNNKGVGEAL